MTAELVRRLQDVARQGELIHYGPIADLLDLDMGLQEHRRRIGEILGQVSRAEHAEGRPLLSAVVVLAGTEMPGKGFFTLARELRLLRGKDDVTFWAS
ncbi:MAG: hypothetical protein AB7N76_00010 [Planctomycetota bacterium]